MCSIDEWKKRLGNAWDSLRGRDVADENVEEDGKPFYFPWWLKLLGGISLIIVLIISAYTYYCYATTAKVHLEPAKLGFPGLVIFALSGLVLLFIPWKEFKLTLKKIGYWEFEKVKYPVQQREIFEELSELRSEINLIKQSFPEYALKQVNQTRTEENPIEAKLLELLLAYGKPVSPSMLLLFAKQQQDSLIKDLEKDEVRDVLQTMVISEQLTTTLSAKGNTLFKIIT